MTFAVLPSSPLYGLSWLPLQLGVWRFALVFNAQYIHDYARLCPGTAFRRKRPSSSGGLAVKPRALSHGEASLKGRKQSHSGDRHDHEWGSLYCCRGLACQTRFTPWGNPRYSPPSREGPCNGGECLCCFGKVTLFSLLAVLRRDIALPRGRVREAGESVFVVLLKRPSSVS